MSQRLTLVLPTRESLPFRQRLQADEATMAYNRHYAPFDGYDPITGCVAFPESDWDDFLTAWVGQEPKRYLAFLRESESGALVGEVNWHESGASMGIVIDAAYRGRGYGAEGLKLLARHAFADCGLTSLRNDFELTRTAAVAAHRAAGFTLCREAAGEAFVLTRETWEANERAALLDALADRMIRHDGGDPKRIQHFLKVHDLAARIGRGEGLDASTQFTLEAAAILHDVGIRPAERKYGHCEGKLQEKEGVVPAHAYLAECGFDAATSARAVFLVAHHHTYDGVDGVDWRILLEADLLVNLYEDNASKEAAESGLKNVFRTDTGKRLCKIMFGLGE